MGNSDGGFQSSSNTKRPRPIATLQSVRASGRHRRHYIRGRQLASPEFGNVHYRQHPLTSSDSGLAAEAGVASLARSYSSVEDKPPTSEGAQEPSVRQVNPLDLVETIREGLLVLEPRPGFAKGEEAANRGGTAKPFDDRFPWIVATGTHPEQVFRTSMQSERWPDYRGRGALASLLRRNSLGVLP
jgi:hypothetical protein